MPESQRNPEATKKVYSGAMFWAMLAAPPRHRLRIGATTIAPSKLVLICRFNMTFSPASSLLAKSWNECSLNGLVRGSDEAVRHAICVKVEPGYRPCRVYGSGPGALHRRWIVHLLDGAVGIAQEAY